MPIIVSRKQPRSKTPLLVGVAVVMLCLGAFFFSRYRHTAAIQALVAEGQACYEQKRFADAITAYQKALALDPPDGPQNVNGTKANLRWRVGVNLDLLGEGAYRQARYPEAQSHFEKALQFDPSNQTYRKNLEWAEAAIAYEKWAAEQNAAARRAAEAERQRMLAMERERRRIERETEALNAKLFGQGANGQADENMLELSGNKMAYERGMASSDPNEVQSQIGYLRLSANNYPGHLRATLDRWIERLEDHLARLRERQRF